MSDKHFALIHGREKCRGGGYCELNQWAYLRRKNEQALDVCRGS